MVSTTTTLPADRRIGLEEIRRWLKSIAGQYSKDDLERLGRACNLALDAYGGHVGSTGDDLLHSALAAADILARMKMDWEGISAAILSDTTTSKDIGAETLAQAFGEKVARMVEDIDRISRFTTLEGTISHEDEAEHAENLRRMLLGLAKDVRVVLIVLARRLHLMRILKEAPDQTRRRIARETLDIYAPLANRLGIWQIKWEMEDLCLRYLHPDEYQRIARQLDGRRQEREQFINSVIALLHEKFHAIGIEAEISGRPKHIYSIWKKMHRKGVDLEQIFDLRAIRVLVDDVAQCYAALGVVHGLWRHIPGEFDDYIATPKANMYQSLHTAVIGPEDKPLEVQIRTWDMHHHAELGVAAHWRYKENTGHDSEFERRVVWMRQWLEKKDGQPPSEGDNPLSELEPDQIYVLTPQSRVIELPKGATPLDFAYAIHTDIGHRCRGAKVDGRIVPLTQPLKSGQSVEILTQKNATPSRDWLNPQLGYLKTSRARNRVRQWFKRQDFEEHVTAGRNALEREIQRLALGERPDLQAVARRYNYKTEEDVLAAIGRGDLSPIQVAGRAGRRAPPKKRTPAAAGVDKSTHSSGEVVIEGVGDLMTHIARCCKPVPYDPLAGFITRGQGVTVHRADCHNIKRAREHEPERLVQARWNNQPTGSTYPVDIQVKAADRKGLLRDISSVFTNDDIDVIGVNTLSDRKTDTATLRFTVEINDINHLSHIITKISQLPEILEVRRLI